MAKNEPKWKDLIEPKIMERNENSQIRFSVIQMKGSEKVNVSIREYAQFLKPEEREVGLKAEQMPFRHTVNGVTFDKKLLNEFIEKLLIVQKNLK